MVRTCGVRRKTGLKSFLRSKYVVEESGPFGVQFILIAKSEAASSYDWEESVNF
jgi:hypothetical protein